jgi:hypothetical protein
MIDNFTIEDAIVIQDGQLANWKKVLKPAVWKELRDAAKKSNLKASAPTHIARGTDLDSWMANYMLGNDYRPF